MQKFLGVALLSQISSQSPVALAALSDFFTVSSVAGTLPLQGAKGNILGTPHPLKYLIDLNENTL